MGTKIEWTDETWNPIVGCSKRSEGCRNCYAERMACRLAQMGHRQYQDVTEGNDKNWFQRWNGHAAFVDSAIDKPLRWRKPRRIFVCSMGDLLHESVNIRGDEIRSIFRVMAQTDHIYMILTKRPERMKVCIEYLYGDDFAEIMPNVWLGVTAENQERADERVPVLLEIPAAVRFISVEPMLGHIDLLSAYTFYEPLENYAQFKAGINWVICGGESGPGARPMRQSWARDLRDGCKTAGVPFFFKQWGEWCYPEQMPDDVYTDIDVNRGLSPWEYEKPWKIGKKAAGRLLDGTTWDGAPS